MRNGLQGGAGLAAPEHAVEDGVGGLRRDAMGGGELSVVEDELERVATGSASERAGRCPVLDDHDPSDYEFKNPLAYLRVAVRDFFGGPGPRWIADLLAELQRHPVDAVLCDAVVTWPILAAEIAGLPSVALSPNVLLSPTPGITPPGMGLRPARGVLGRCRDAILRGVAGRVFDGGLPVSADSAPGRRSRGRRYFEAGVQSVRQAGPGEVGGDVGQYAGDVIVGQAVLGVPA